MANHSTEKIRIYRKNGKICHDDIQRIHQHITNKDLGSDLIGKLFVDLDSMFLEIHSTSRRPLSLRFDETLTNYYIIWEILSDEGGYSSILLSSLYKQYWESSIYQFQKMRFRGNESFLREFVKKLCYGNHSKSKILEKGYLEYEFNGFYQSNIYDSSGTSLLKKIELSNLDEIMKLHNAEFTNFMPSRMMKFEEVFLNEAYSEPIRIDEGIEAVEFIFEGRITNQIIWNNRYWEHKGCDSWDNLSNPMWVKFNNSITNENNM